MEIARRHRSLHGHVGPAGVQIRPAEVVVGVPGIGRQGHHDAGARRWTHDEEGEVTAHLLADGNLHDHLVVARAPPRLDVNQEHDRPAAPLRGSILRRLVLVRGHGVGTEDDLRCPPTLVTSTRTGRPPDDEMCRPTCRRNALTGASSTRSPPHGSCPDHNGTRLVGFDSGSRWGTGRQGAPVPSGWKGRRTSSGRTGGSQPDLTR